MDEFHWKFLVACKLDGVRCREIATVDFVDADADADADADGDRKWR